MNRTTLAYGLAVLLAVALTGCGPSGGGGGSNTATAPSGSPAAPIALTDAQKKTLIAELPAAYQVADLSNGEAKFAVCRSCHTTPEGGDDMTGPNLWGVFGRKAGSKPEFAYSDDLKNAGWAWDADRLDKWIENPRGVLAGTKMTFVGVPDAKDRRDVIAFLKVQTSAAPNSPRP
ncbi:MAG TPA: cytochrome c family protein [Caulobacteraceae bacterium]|nr:cytochrome c family protein [Caulobacteraceae bacterium]